MLVFCLKVKILERQNPADVGSWNQTFCGLSSGLTNEAWKRVAAVISVEDRDVFANKNK